MKKLIINRLAVFFAVIFLLVMTGCGGSGGDENFGPTNPGAPIAKAGSNQTVKQGDVVYLDGSGSSNAKQFKWSFLSKPSDSKAMLNGTDQVKVSFTADKDGVYVVGLVVNNGTVDSGSDSLAVTATVNDHPAIPIANAGPDQSVKTGTLVQLNGSASCSPVTYKWAFLSKPAQSAVTLSSVITANPTFTPDLEGTYVLSLVVNDGNADSLADTVSITVTKAIINALPTANAGPDQKVTTGATAQLNGNGSRDADGDNLNYKWSLTVKPIGSNASLSKANLVNPTFVADKDGTYVASLIVNDSAQDSVVDTISIVASTPVPIAGYIADTILCNGVVVDPNGGFMGVGASKTVFTITEKISVFTMLTDIHLSKFYVKHVITDASGNLKVVNVTDPPHMPTVVWAKDYFWTDLPGLTVGQYTATVSFKIDDQDYKEIQVIKFEIK